MFSIVKCQYKKTPPVKVAFFYDIVYPETRLDSFSTCFQSLQV